jgi:hypothetical protein
MEDFAGPWTEAHAISIKEPNREGSIHQRGPAEVKQLSNADLRERGWFFVVKQLSNANLGPILGKEVGFQQQKPSVAQK